MRKNFDKKRTPLKLLQIDFIINEKRDDKSFVEKSVSQFSFFAIFSAIFSVRNFNGEKVSFKLTTCDEFI